MKHPTEEQLILYHYGEDEDRREVADHLVTCADCRVSYQTLRQTLDHVQTTPIPERGADYGAQVWRRLRPQLTKERAASPARLFRALAARIPAFNVGTAAWASGLAVLLAAAFLLGRSWPGSATQPPLAFARERQSPAGQSRERILLAELGAHLEQSQRALIELLNLQTNAVIDISPEREMARQLVDVNRLYRVTAVRLGDTAMASLLEDLERTLIEISDGPATLSGPELSEFRQRIQSDEVLFKVRIVRARVRAEEQWWAGKAATKTIGL